MVQADTSQTASLQLQGCTEETLKLVRFSDTMIPMIPKKEGAWPDNEINKM